MQQPKNFKLAIGLLSAGLICFILQNILPPFFAHTTWPHLHLYFFPVEALIYLFLIWQIKLGQSWARIVTVILFIVSLIGLLALYAMTNTIPEVFHHMFSSGSKSTPAFFMMFSPENHDAMATLYLIGTIEKILEAIAITLLFGKQINTFFHQTNLGDKNDQ